MTAQDSTTKKTYSVTVTRAPAANANLAFLHPGRGTLSPVFSSAVTSYTDSVNNSVSTIQIRPTVVDNNATITVNGIGVASGALSQSIPLAVGNTTITTVVTAQDSTTKKTYTLVVNRATGADNNAYQPVGVEKPVDNTDGSTAVTADTTSSTSSLMKLLD